VIFIKINSVKRAVQLAGGPTVVANKLKCSGATVHAWIKKERVSNIEKAKALSDISGIGIKEIRPC
jgi:hypothetical protein